MALNKDFEDLLRCFNDAKVEYLIIGAYAVIYYTEPRYTKDLDLWINPSRQNAEKVFKALKKFGAPVKKLTLEDLTNKELVYQIGVEPNRIDILMGIGSHPFKKAWKNKKTSSYGHEKIYIISLKDLIKAKKEVGRTKDKLDLELLSEISKRKKRIMG